ncbi:MAG: hypothetical protein AAGU11_11660, partial [Syntrophobacteraceae bacterium]
MARPICKRNGECGEASAQVSFDENRLVQVLAGEQNGNLKAIEKQLEVRVHLRGNLFTVTGARTNVEVAERLLYELADLARSGYPVFGSDVVFAIQILSENINRRLKDIFLDQ